MNDGQIYQYMLSSPKAASSMSGQTSEVRYQKALREITKLINVNNESKDEIARAHETIEEYERMLRDKDDKIEELMSQKQSLESDVQDLNIQCLDLQEENNSLQEEINSLRNKSPTDKDPPTRSTYDPQNRATSRSKDSSSEYKKIIEELQSALEKKNEKISALSLALKGEEAEEKLSTKEVLVSLGEAGRNQSEEAQLKRKLKSANDYIKRLSSECADLKTSLMRAENTNSILKAVSEKKLTSYSPALSPRSRFEYINEGSATQIHKRYKKLDAEFNKLSKKYEQTKAELSKNKQELEEIQFSNQCLKDKNEKFQLLIEKQQDELDEIIKKNETDMDEMTKQFKEKLLEQRQSFNPTKNAKAVKMMEGIQSENKALKKKFQLCSIELTKCFKTLEIYKTKLAECEQEYNELAMEKEGLMEKLSRMQQGRSKQKSSYSREKDSKFGDNPGSGNFN